MLSIKQLVDAQANISIQVQPAGTYSRLGAFLVTMMAHGFWSMLRSRGKVSPTALMPGLHGIDQDGEAIQYGK